MMEIINDLNSITRDVAITLLEVLELFEYSIQPFMIVFVCLSTYSTLVFQEKTYSSQPFPYPFIEKI